MRDYSLDLLKGLACVLMVFAHSTGVYSPLTSILTGENDTLTKLIYLAGEFAPVFFFSVAGITGYIQAGKYHPKSVLASYLFLFLLGFSYNGITQRNFYDNFEIEIIQIVAIGALSVYLVRYALRPAPVIFLAFALVLFAFKISSEHFHWLEGMTNTVRGIILPPGTFPLLPWLFLFFMGVFAYHTNNVNNLALAIISIGLFDALTWLSFPLEPSNKWDMSIGNFLINCFLLFASFYLIRRSGFLKNTFGKPLLQSWCKYFQRLCANILGMWKVGRRLLLFWGTYSLLFLFVHKFVIMVLHKSTILDVLHFLLRSPYIFWFAVLVITSILMKLILDASSKEFIRNIFEDIRAWFALAGLVLLVPFLIGNDKVVYGVEFLLGIVFSIYYPLLRKTLKPPHRLETDMPALPYIES
jgi:fucose 4-O-acetylase-like acetyltransferase